MFIGLASSHGYLSKIEHEQFSRFDSSNLQYFFLAGGRAVADTQELPLSITLPRAICDHAWRPGLR